MKKKLILAATIIGSVAFGAAGEKTTNTSVGGSGPGAATGTGTGEGYPKGPDDVQGNAAASTNVKNKKAVRTQTTTRQETTGAVGAAGSAGAVDHTYDANSAHNRNAAAPGYNASGSTTGGNTTGSVNTDSRGMIGSPNTDGGAAVTTTENSTTNNKETRYNKDSRNYKDRNDNKGVKADNSKINQRDRVDNAKVADVQSNNESDVELTRKIRQNIADTKGLSTYGQNIKIIANGGRVVLKGPVRTAGEKQQIEQIASSVAGAGNVVNQIDVVTK
ncbi:MAG: BON domain-containing protein [Bdellovibrionota bacterium]